MTRRTSRTVAASVSRGVVAATVGVVALYTLTVVGVWVLAWTVDLRGDAHHHLPAHPSKP